MASAESPPESRSRRPRAAGEQPLIDRSFSADDLYALRAEVAAHVSALDAGRGDLERVLIVASELATNAIRHGGGSGQLTLWWDGHLVHCRVSDRGPGLADPEAGRTPPDPSAPGGRGLWLCRKLSDRLEIEPTPHVMVTAGIAINHPGSDAAPRPIPIRLATAADVPGIEALVHEAYARWVPRIGQRPAPMSADYHRLVRDGVAWVAVPHEAVAGVIVLISHADHLLIENVAVAPDQQGLGIGSQLLRFAEEQAHQSGRLELRLYTHELMTENLALYRRRGYEETHREAQHGFRRVFLSKTLSR